MKKSALLIAGGLALSLSLTACGGNDDAEAADAISASMLEQSDEEFPVDQGQADCVGEGLVDRVGVDQLQEYGLLTNDLEMANSVGEVTMEEADADNAADVIVSCVNAQEMLMEQLGADDTLGEKEQGCINEVMDEAALTQLFSMMFQGKEEEGTTELMEPLMTCMMG